MSYTPGPWDLDDENAVCAQNRVLAVTYPSPRTLFVGQDDNEWDANARLMRAAPDLLVALKWMVDEFDHGHGLESVKAARAAIAKAEVERGR